MQLVAPKPTNDHSNSIGDSMTAHKKLLILERDPVVHHFWDVGDLLKTHVYRRSVAAFAQGDAARDAILTRSALRRRQREVRRFFLKSLGGLPPCDTPIHARPVGEVVGDGFTIEKIIFESRPGAFVTANLYRPPGLKGKTGAVLFLCGHHAEAKHVAEYQAVCQTLVQSGLVVLAQDPIGQGERFSYHDPKTGRQAVSCCCPEHDYAGAQCLPLGQTIGRYFLHDAMRGIDYLISRSEVDPKRIGVTGNSGGGTQTSMVMLADRRIAAAAPATFIMNRESYLWTGQAQDAEQIWPGFTATGYDHEDILLAMCPKPVRVLAVQSDFFPIEGTRRTVARSRRLWELCGKPKNLDLIEDASIHAYTPRLAEAAAEFFAKHLLGIGKRFAARSAIFPTSQLWCTRTGQVMGELPGARTVYHENQRELRKDRKLPGRQAALAWLRDRVITGREKCDPNPRFNPPEQCGELTAIQSFWWSQPGLMNHGMLFQTRKADKRRPVTLAVWDGGTTALRPHWTWIRSQCRTGRAVLVLDVTGAGALQPNALNPNPPLEFYGVIHKLADDLLWLGDDLAALRTYDVIRALDVLTQWPGLDAGKIACYAHGNQGVYAQLAAALDRRIRSIQVVGGIGSYTAFVRKRHYVQHDIKSILLRGIIPVGDLPTLTRSKPVRRQCKARSFHKKQ